MSAHRIAARYAKSLIDLAVDQNNLERVREDIGHFREATKVRDLWLMLKSPIVHAQKKGQILKSIFSDVYNDLTMAFFDIILRKGREAYLPEIADAFIEQYRDIKQISVVKVTTAVPLDEQRLDEIRKKIVESGVTYPNVQLETDVNPEIVGGFVLEFEHKLYDASVAHQIEELRKEFASGR